MNNKFNKTFYKDTFSFDLEGNRKFQPGDKVIVGIAKSTYSDEDVIPLKIINITEEQESLNITYTPEEMKPVEPGDYILEVKLIYSGIVETIIQEKIEIERVVIDEIPN